MLFVYIVKISHLTKFKCGSFLLKEEEERRRWLKKEKEERTGPKKKDTEPV